MKLINFNKFTDVAFFWLILLIFFSIFDYIKCKGTGVISASGGGSGEICVDCGVNYTDEELKWALIVLCTILTIFLLILCCQCSSRIINECERQKRLKSKDSETLSNGYLRRMHSCDHSFYGAGSTRSVGQSTIVNNFNNSKQNRNAIKNLNYSQSQLNHDKAFEHCSVKAIACGPTQCAKAITSPELKPKSPLISSIEHYHHFPETYNHYLPKSYNHLPNLEQNNSLENLNQLKYNGQFENKLKNKNLKRSATLAECNWPVVEDLNNYAHRIHSAHNSDIYHQQLKRNAQTTKKLVDSVSPSNRTKKLDTKATNTGKLNASSLATVIAAHNKFVKLKKNFARTNTNQSFKSLPAPRYVRSNVNTMVNQTTEYI